MNLSQLIAAGADVNVRDHHHRQTPLHIATLWNDLRSVRQLIAAGADVDARDAKGETPIQLAQRELANCADAAEETDAFQAIIDEIEHHCRSRDLAHLHATVPQAAGDPAQTPNPPKPRHGLRL